MRGDFILLHPISTVKDHTQPKAEPISQAGRGGAAGEVAADASTARMQQQQFRVLQHPTHGTPAADKL